MSKRQHPNIHHWKLGAEALERLCGSKLYVCPLCLRDFPEDQATTALTREDVPPRSLGGKKLLLTCRPCNSKAGSKLDSHARAAEDVRQFVTGSNYPKLKARLIELNANVELSKEGDGNLIRYLPKNNPPDRMGELVQATSQWGDGTDIQLQVGRRHIPLRAMISWLKTGYLLTFAWLGYRYILRDVLDTVRTQIREPETRHIEGFYAFDPSANAQRIIAIQQPEWARGIAVVAQGRIVLLPLFDDDVDFYRRISDRGRQLNRVSIQGRALSWPEKAIYRLDHATPHELAAFSSLRW